MKRSVKKKVKYFEERVFYYQKILSLLNYEISVYGIEDDPTTRASWIVDDEGKSVSIRYNNIWIDEKGLTFGEIDKVAFHEVYEMSFSVIRYLLMQYHSVSLTNGLVHQNVRRMENVLWPLIKDKR